MFNKKNFICDKIEVIKKAYDKQGRVIQEQWEYYYPKEKEVNIGFNIKKNGKKQVEQ